MVKRRLCTPSFSPQIQILFFKRDLRKDKEERGERKGDGEGERKTHANTLRQRREKSHTIPVGMSQTLQPKATAPHKSMVVFGRDEPTPVSLFILLHRVCQED